MPSLLPIDEPMVRWRGMSRVWQGMIRMPETPGVDMAATLAHYNSSWGTWNMHDDLLVRQQRMLPEEVLR
jgi:hypothetical protein